MNYSVEYQYTQFEMTSSSSLPEIIGNDTLVLKLYVKPGNPELLAKYKELSVAHNKKLETSMYPDSGFDLLIPCNYWEDDVSYASNRLSETTFKLPLSIKCAFVHDISYRKMLHVCIHKDVSEFEVEQHVMKYDMKIYEKVALPKTDYFVYNVDLNYELMRNSDSNYNREYEKYKNANNYIRENNGRSFSHTYQHLPPIQVIMKYFGYYLYPRSSIVKTSIRLANSVGIIDSGYRGEIMAVVDKHDTSNDWKTVLNRDCKQYDRLFQICAGDLKPFRVEIVESECELSCVTERGDGGFGSTGR